MNLLRLYLRAQNLMGFLKVVRESFKGDFPDLPNYESFLKATNRSGMFIYLRVKYLMHWNGNKEHYVDSTEVAVCKDHNIYKYRIAKEIAAGVKTTKGWFYGFKRHGVCTSVYDAGYSMKGEDVAMFFKEEKRFYIAARKTMKRLMIKKQHELFKRRSVVANIWNALRERLNSA